MKIIDLLNKIANGEENDLQTEFVFDKKVYNFYKFKNESGYCLDGWLLNQEIQITKSLNDEVEIIEKKKIPEKLECYHQYDECVVKDKFYQDQKGSLVDEIIIDKLNEVIDYLKSKGE